MRNAPSRHAFMDISVSFPNEGCIRLRSRFLFADPESDYCRKFVERVLKAGEVSSVTVKGDGALVGSNLAEIRYCPQSCTRQQAIAAIYAHLINGDGASSHANGHTAPHRVVG